LRILTAVIAIAGTLLGASSSLADGDTFGELQRDGLALAERMCAQCHAIGRIGASAHGAAPAFRDLDRRIDLDRFTGQLRQGLVSGHPDMPTFRFSPEDARALTAYLRAIQQ
jgi:mono/diheme cytochrome c family protein